jgi:hypothetical protein
VIYGIRLVWSENDVGHGGLERPRDLLYASWFRLRVGVKNYISAAHYPPAGVGIAGFAATVAGIVPTTPGAGVLQPHVHRSVGSRFRRSVVLRGTQVHGRRERAALGLDGSSARKPVVLPVGRSKRAG